MTVLKFQQFVNERLNENSLPNEYEESIEYVSDMMKQDEAPSKEIINAMKKLKGHEGNTAIIGDWGAVDDYNKVKKDLKKLNIKFIESKDDNGNFVAFVNEGLNEKINMRDIKLIKKHFSHSEQNIADWDIVGDNDVLTIKGPNPYDDGNEYTWSWDGENAWNETSMRGGVPSGGEWSKPVKGVDTFIELMDNGKLNDGGEWD